MASVDDYTPQSALEKSYFDSLWTMANISNAPELGGREAVTFFQRSSVDVGVLKQIWSLCTPVATMNPAQFYTALRYIAMFQSGEFPLSKERMKATARTDLGYPKFSGVNPPPIPSKAGGAQPQVPVAAGGTGPAAGGVSGPNPALYALSPIEHQKYHGLFLNYDTDKDGYLSYEEAISVFQQSGAPPGVLQAVYAMADDDKDRRLSSKEFCVAFHLILCISKKRLPVPPGLPGHLRGFLMNAPAVPGGAPTPNPAHSAAPVPSPAPGPGPSTASAPSATSVPLPVPAGAAKDNNNNNNISSAFDSIPAPLSSPSSSSSSASALPGFPLLAESGAPFAGPSSSLSSSAAASLPDPASLSGGSGFGKDESELGAGIDALKQSARRAVAANDSALDATSRASTSLNSMKQRLALDKISLEATVSNAEASTRESIQRLETTLRDIEGLHVQLKELREKLDSQRSEQSNMQDQQMAATAEKQRLVFEVESTLKQLSNANKEANQSANQLGTVQAQLEGTMASNQAQIQEEARLGAQVANTQTEIDTLRAILTNMQMERDKAVAESSRLHSQLQSAQGQLMSAQMLEREKRERIDELSAQLKALELQRSELSSQQQNHQSTSAQRTSATASASGIGISTFAGALPAVAASADYDPFGDIQEEDDHAQGEGNPLSMGSNAGLSTKTPDSSSAVDFGFGDVYASDEPSHEADAHAGAAADSGKSSGELGEEDPFAAAEKSGAFTNTAVSAMHPSAPVSSADGPSSAGFGDYAFVDPPTAAGEGDPETQSTQSPPPPSSAPELAPSLTVVSSAPSGSSGDPFVVNDSAKSGGFGSPEPGSAAGDSSGTSAFDDSFSDASPSTAASFNPSAAPSATSASSLPTSAEAEDSGAGIADEDPFDAFGAGSPAPVAFSPVAGDSKVAAVMVTDPFAGFDTNPDAGGALAGAGEIDPFDAFGGGEAAVSGMGDGFDAFGDSALTGADAQGTNAAGFDPFADPAPVAGSSSSPPGGDPFDAFG